MLGGFHDVSVMQPILGSNTMASLTLKGIPDDLLTRLRRVAEARVRQGSRMGGADLVA